MKMKLEKLKYKPTRELLASATVLLQAAKTRDGRNFGNAGTVENMIDKMNMRLSVRIDSEGKIENESAHTYRK